MSISCIQDAIGKCIFCKGHPQSVCPASFGFIASPVSHGGKVPSRSAPGFIEKVRNFAAAAAGHVAAGLPMASDEEIIRRHDICLGCEFLQDNACTQCGCPVARVRGYVSKLSWADSECPVGKWGKTASQP